MFAGQNLCQHLFRFRVYTKVPLAGLRRFLGKPTGEGDEPRWATAAGWHGLLQGLEDFLVGFALCTGFLTGFLEKFLLVFPALLVFYGFLKDLFGGRPVFWSFEIFSTFSGYWASLAA